MKGEEARIVDEFEFEEEDPNVSHGCIRVIVH
jgi:lipoprotein-anchoring transpeptidase ErfK/SrfK